MICAAATICLLDSVMLSGIAFPFNGYWGVSKIPFM